MADQKKTTIKFHYLKSSLCRDIHASGFFGGINTGSGEVHLSVYSERPPIPKTITMNVSDDGSLGDELVDLREGRDGVVRIVQDTLYLDLPTALSLHQWLSERIETFKRVNPGVIEEVRK